MSDTRLFIVVVRLSASQIRHLTPRTFLSSRDSARVRGGCILERQFRDQGTGHAYGGYTGLVGRDVDVEMRSNQSVDIKFQVTSRCDGFHGLELVLW